MASPVGRRMQGQPRYQRPPEPEPTLVSRRGTGVCRHIPTQAYLGAWVVARASAAPSGIPSPEVPGSQGRGIEKGE